MSKKYGIGYTIYQYNNGIKMPVSNFKAVPGNVADAMRVLDKKIKEIGRSHQLRSLMFASFLWGATVRLALAV